jgi:hypothetical protein
MHVAIAVGTLLLGSWVIHSPVDEDESAVVNRHQPPATAPAVRSHTPGSLDRGDKRFSEDSPGMDSRLEGRQRGRTKSGDESARTKQPAASGVMPSAPTDSESVDLNQPPAPTSGNSADSSQQTAGLGGVPRSRYPIAPTSGRPSGQSVLRSGLHTALAKNALGEVPGGTARFMTPPTAAPPADKPYSNYRASSGVSPYMNLFRSGFGGVDNYSTLVRPQLEQRTLNQKFGRDIGGLEQDLRSRNLDLQLLNQASRTPQTVTSPQYYMNLGGYYPGYNAQP